MLRTRKLTRGIKVYEEGNRHKKTTQQVESVCVLGLWWSICERPRVCAIMRSESVRVPCVTMESSTRTDSGVVFCSGVALVLILLSHARASLVPSVRFGERVGFGGARQDSADVVRYILYYDIKAARCGVVA